MLIQSKSVLHQWRSHCCIQQYGAVMLSEVPCRCITQQDVSIGSCCLQAAPSTTDPKHILAKKGLGHLNSPDNPQQA